MTLGVAPLARAVAALTLPFVVPLLVTLALFALPGDPADLLCPRGSCEGTDALARALRVDRGPLAFYADWMTAALRGELGNSWRVVQGRAIAELVGNALPNTVTISALATLGLLATVALGLVRGRLARLDVVWQTIGIAPAVMVALVAAAAIELNYGVASHGVADRWRIVLGALTLIVADGSMAHAVSGTRQTVQTEFRRRYIEVARLRGESLWGNALPNILPALARQWRARVLAVLSGTVGVVVVIQVDGLGRLLFLGTLKQDFRVVLAAAWLFAVAAAGLLLVQAVIDGIVAVMVRRVPAGIEGPS